MKTLNLALIVALALTSASAMATSTGSSHSLTIGHGTTNATTTYHDHTRGSGIAKSYQDIDAGGHTSRVERYKVGGFVNGSSKSVSRNGFTSINDGYSVGALSVNIGTKEGAVSTDSTGSSYERGYKVGRYTETSVANGGRDVVKESGRFNSGSRTHKNTTSTQVTHYNSDYTTVDFEY